MITPGKARKLAKTIGDMVLPRGYNNFALQDASDALRDLAAQVEALQADAERYRWLRDVSIDDLPSDDWWSFVLGDSCGVAFDAAIDAAREQS